MLKQHPMLAARSSPSSGPAVLTTVPAVEAFLQGTPFTSRSVADLPGGTGNYTYRIHLLFPFKGCDTVVLKHAQPYAKAWASLAFDLKRQTFEVEAIQRIKSWLPSTSLVTVPEIYHFDANNNVIIMEDCGVDIATLKVFLRSSKAASSPCLAETIGASLGEFIASMHEWSRCNPDGILDRFDTYEQAKKLSAWVTYGRAVETLNNVGNNVPEVLKTGSFKVDASDLRVISEIVDETQADMMSARDVFVMGDFWPGNIVVKLNSDQTLQRLYVLDWELAKTGIPGVELGQFCAEMHLLTRFDKVARAHASALLFHLLDAYSRKARPDDTLPRRVLAHMGVHLVVFTPRMPQEWTDKEIICDVVTEGISFMVGSRNPDYVARSVVKGLLPEHILT